MTKHQDIGVGFLHIVYNWTYADAATREADTSVVIADEGKLARQTDDDSLWMLLTDTPTWIRVGGGGGGDLTEDFALSGDISPTAIAANQNNYAPTGLATAAVLRLTASGAGFNITGLTGGSDGRVFVIYNIGSNRINLTANDANSTAANRFGFKYDFVLQPSGGCVVMYDATSSLWRLVGDSFEFTVNDGGVSPVIARGVRELIVPEGSLTDNANGTATIAYARALLVALGLLAQVADIGATNLTGTNTTGLYLITVYLVVSTADITAGIVTVTIGWTDNGAARTQALSVNLIATNKDSATILAQRASGFVTYTVTHTGAYGAAAYSLYISAERKV